jgi:hypothetical protein
MNERSFIVNTYSPTLMRFSLDDPAWFFSLFLKRAPSLGSSGWQPAIASPGSPAASRHRLLRPCIQIHFHRVLGHDWHSLRWCHLITKGSWGRLRDELANRGDHAQYASRIYRCFHPAPALLLRVDQEPVYRLSFVVHNFKTPRTYRFV